VAIPTGGPERLRADCEDSLRRLRLETIDLWQLHRIDPEVPLEEQFGAIRELRDEGKIRFVGVSEVSVEELRRARQLIEIATVQNRFNLAERAAEDVLRACEADGLGFLPWAPIGMGDVLDSMDALASAAARHGATQAQMALAWLLHRSPVVLPIPGTGSPEHLRENLGAALIELSEDDLAALEAEPRNRADSRRGDRSPQARKRDAARRPVRRRHRLRRRTALAATNLTRARRPGPTISASCLSRRRLGHAFGSVTRRPRATDPSAEGKRTRQPPSGRSPIQ
jgi:Predicted oxidoreductases (related to aryl-alcohol dehydrogenases)